MKKYILSLFLIALSLAGMAQLYNPSLHTVTNKALGIAQANPTDARSFYYDQALFKYRPYQSTSEVLTYLNLQKYRFGNFSIYANLTGTLQPDGSFTDSTITEYWFIGCVNDTCLKVKSSGGGGGSGVTSITGGFGLDGGTIISTGTLSVDSLYEIASKFRVMQVADSLAAVTNLQRVTDAGNTTTNFIESRSSAFPYIQVAKDGPTNPAVARLAISESLGTLQVSDTNNLNTYYQFMRIKNASNNSLVLPDGTGVDTLALLSNVRAASVTASNGLTKTVNDITLGGSLAGNTTISGLTNTLTYSTTNFGSFEYGNSSFKLGYTGMGVYSTILEGNVSGLTGGRFETYDATLGSAGMQVKVLTDSIGQMLLASSGRVDGVTKSAGVDMRAGGIVITSIDSVTLAENGNETVGKKISYASNIEINSPVQLTHKRYVDSMVSTASGGGTTSGTYATKTGLTPSAGDRYYQTDYIVGNYVYNGTSWDYIHDHKTIFYTAFQYSPVGNNSLPQHIFTNINSGTGAASSTGASSFTGEVGNFWSVSTGTTATGYSNMAAQSGNVIGRTVLVNGNIYGAFDAAVSALSNGTETYTAYAGYVSATPTVDTNGVYFRYTDADSSGNWIAVAKSGASKTEVDTGIPVVARSNSGGYHDLVIHYTDTEVKYYIDATLVATITTNIPAENTGGGWVIGIRKTAGTTSRTFTIHAALSISGAQNFINF